MLHTPPTVATVVPVQGRIDALAVRDLYDQLAQRLVGGPASLVIDCIQLSYLSSAGTRTLMQALHEARARGGDIRLARVPPRIYEIFELTGLVEDIAIYSSVDEAVASYQLPARR